METAAKLPQAGAPQHSNEHADLDAGGSRDLPAQLNALRSLGKQELRSEWRRLYRSRPPRLSRDLLMRGVAYRVQELAHGGLSKTALRKLGELAQGLVLQRKLGRYIAGSERRITVSAHRSNGRPVRKRA